MKKIVIYCVCVNKLKTVDTVTGEKMS